MKKLLVLTTMLLAIACSKESETTITEKHPIVGAWLAISEWSEGFESDIYYFASESEVLLLEFRDNGVLEIHGNQPSVLTYRTDGQQICLSEPLIEAECGGFNITANELTIWEYTELADDPNNPGQSIYGNHYIKFQKQ